MEGNDILFRYEAFGLAYSIKCESTLPSPVCALVHCVLNPPAFEYEANGFHSFLARFLLPRVRFGAVGRICLLSCQREFQHGSWVCLRVGVCLCRRECVCWSGGFTCVSVGNSFHEHSATHTVKHARVHPTLAVFVCFEASCPYSECCLPYSREMFRKRHRKTISVDDKGAPVQPIADSGSGMAVV